MTAMRTCGFPGCDEPVDATPGVGRPSEPAVQVDELRTTLDALEQRATTLESDPVAAGEDNARANDELTALTAQLAVQTLENVTVVAQLVEAQNLVTAATAIKDEAVAAARAAAVQADADEARAERAETEAANTRALLDQVRLEGERVRAEVLLLNGRLATVISEREQRTRADRAEANTTRPSQK